MSHCSSPVVFGLDVGGTKLAAAAITQEGTIRKHLLVPTEAHDGGDVVLSRLCELAQQLKISVDAEVVGIGVATHGIVEPDTGIVRFASSNLPGWTGTDLKASLSEVFPDIPIQVANDGHAAALAEHRFGCGRGISEFAVLVLGTGVGGGIISNGRLLNGANGAAGRLGHLSIDLEGPRCSCGNRGCLELYVSGTAIAKEASELQEFSLSTKHISTPALTAHDVIRSAKEDDPLARQILSTAGEQLGHALVQIGRVFDPERIAIGGGLVSAGDLLLEPARRVVQEGTPPELVPPVIEFALLGENASLIGAATLGWEAVSLHERRC
jgi:glucokinase